MALRPNVARIGCSTSLPSQDQDLNCQQTSCSSRVRRPLLKPAEATKLRAAVRELDAFIVLAATPDVFETVAFPERLRQQTVEAIWCTPPAHTPARADEGRLRYQSVAALRRMDSMDHAPTA